MRRADLLVLNGLELDQWAEPSSGREQSEGLPGRPGAWMPLRAFRPGGADHAVDRSLGDVHPVGNPHYTPDPGMAARSPRISSTGSRDSRPQTRAAFERNRAAFLARLDQAMTRWLAALAPFKGAKVVQYHPDFIYLFVRFGLVKGGAIEDRPGIPATPVAPGPPHPAT